MNNKKEKTLLYSLDLAARTQATRKVRVGPPFIAGLGIFIYISKTINHIINRGATEVRNQIAPYNLKMY